MKNRKSNNSALVLAMLGVYLGLALAGAAPQVLANAALTRNFDITDEIGRSDDLDKDPNDERSPLTTSVQIYLEDVEYFLATLGRLAEGGKFDPKKDTFEIAQNTLLPCVDSNKAGRYTPVKFASSSSEARSALSYFSRGMVYGYSLGDCVGNTEFTGVNAVDSRFDVKLDDKGFAVDITVKKDSPQSARDLFDSLNSVLKLYNSRENTKLRQKVVEQTRFAFRDDLVFIRFYLARSDLASLATDAK